MGKNMAQRYGLAKRVTRAELERAFPKALATKSLIMIVGTYPKDREQPYFGACYEFTGEFRTEADRGPDAEMELRGITENRFSKDGDAMFAVLSAYEFWTSKVW